MKPQTVFSFLRIVTSFLFYIMIFLAGCVVLMAALTFLGIKTEPGSIQFSHEVMAFVADKKYTETYNVNVKSPLVIGANLNGRNTGTSVSPDSLIRYSPVVNRYHLEVKPNSALGYYSFSVIFFNFLLAIGILWLFRRIFSEVNVTTPFKQRIFKYLISLAILFGVSDVLKLAHYIIFNQLIHQSLPNPNFDLVTEVGGSFMTGLIIYAIAIVYQRGIVLQEENTLTV
ncbi:Protein of unknown function (DUF2975) [Larkinella arboricola]|uniref:DUF2975 family protein n=1 Tax=Larkinella arboricola TaxID=643671 RepID=A0A327X1H2_LARAB|nr:DUF2975 domain-containing protein [Larkinella arboricola]RAK00351.1 Protein of unknown function (DUF2975) [Larkinella arboricola]